MTTQVLVHLKHYAKRIREQLRANAAVSEPALAPIFQELVTSLLPLLPAVPKLTVSPEFNKPGVGRPDIALIRPGQPPRAFVELKAPAKDANPERWKGAHDKRQFERLKELAHWSTSNFADFLLFGRDAALGQAAIVPPLSLKAETKDSTADEAIDAHHPAAFLDLLAALARAEAPEAKNAKELAELMAHSAKLVRSAVFERVGQLHAEGKANDPLMMVRETFRNVLYAHPEAGGYAAKDFDELFSSAFAQTLAFGLLLVREASDGPVGEDAWKQMPDEHPLLKAALRVLSEDEVTSQIGIGFEVMRDCVNSFAPEILAPQKDGRDPILYFYEDFLQTFDPAAREKYGVYYTPLEVVRYMTGALDRALRDNLGTKGLRDPKVTILDPATGTGTFLLGVAERVRDQVMADEGGKAASSALRNLAGRMFGFELLVGPYAVAHYRLHHALRYRPADEDEDKPQAVKLPRLGVYLADTLAAPGAVSPLGTLGIQGIPIDDERREANRIKTEQPILAIIGNPPYRRLKEGERGTLIGHWLDQVWHDLKQPVSDAGKGGDLKSFHEFSIAFWRWSIWKMFEADNAPKRGVVAFISNRKFLTGWTFAGLRQMMRLRFDRIEIIDLRGDLNAGPRGDVASDEGVFAIKVGTAITLCISDGSKAPGELAEVRYSDSWDEDLYRKRAKLEWLEEKASGGQMDCWTTVDRGSLDDFRPEPFQNGEWLSVREAFSFSKSGMKSGDDAVFVRVYRADLKANILPLIAARADPSYAPELEKALAYRPLDNQWFYNDATLLNRHGPDMQAAWGQQNIGFYALKSNTGAGPGIWCHSLLPDYHSIKGSNGGYAFPLHDRRAGPDAHNLNPVLVAALAEAYGAAQTPENIFDAILCLLSATSYTQLFAEDLEDTFPHIPFPADPAVFARAAEIGREIRGLEAFQRDPATAFRPKAFCKLATDTDTGAVIADVAYNDSELSLWKADGKAVTAFTGLPEAVWSFAVSGYRVLSRWIDGRKGLPFSDELKTELRDVAARIHELIHWFAEADLVLAATLADTIPRTGLGFPPAGPDEVEDGDD